MNFTVPMDFNEMFDFLEKLRDNNNKEWMDANRKWYRSIRDDFVLWLDSLDLELSHLHDNYYSTPGKRGINRINNNLMYHPLKPVYKDHFGAVLDKAPNSADFYIELGVDNCLVAGGFWRPGPRTLASIRQGIDYNGEELVELMDKPSFKKTFGGFYKDERLTRPPKGYFADHPHLELLKNKTFAVEHRFPRADALSEGFREKVLALYMEMLPFRNYLNQAASV